MAASYWSLLAPAIEMAAKSKIYGSEGEYAFVPVGVGFLIGAAFVYGTDALISSLGIQSPNVLLAMQSVGTKQRRQILEKLKSDEDLNDYDPYNDLQLSGGNICTQFHSTTIDGISFCFLLTSNTFCRLGKWDQFMIHASVSICKCQHTHVPLRFFYIKQ